jgi:hypothetical protein
MSVVYMDSFLPMMLILLVSTYSALVNTQRTPCHARKTFFFFIQIVHHINATYGKVHSNQLCHALQSASLFGTWEVNEGQVNIRWMTMPAAPDGILENVNCG